MFNVENSAKIAYLALYSMQHRGQEAAGISSSNGKKIKTVKGLGLVSQVFTKEGLASLSGALSIGHNRYSTAGANSIEDAQPLCATLNSGDLALAHNGNLTNSRTLREALIKNGAVFQSQTDTENIIHIIARSKEASLTERVKEALLQIKGAYSLVFLSADLMIAARDPNGIRPLCIGALGGGFIVASETCAFDLVGAKYLRDVDPAEMVVFEKGGARSIKFTTPNAKHCIFESVYFARSDSLLRGKTAYETRKQMGRELASQDDLKADIVVPVPASAIPHAIGYAEQTGIPLELAITKSHAGRSFIQPLKEVRDLMVRQKLKPIRELIYGKILALIDDSIVRGTTGKQIISLLFEAGAKEVHMRVASPPVCYPCFYGIDTPSKSELIVARLGIEKTAQALGANSLKFLSLGALKRSVGDSGNFCCACFDGKYFHK